MKLAEPTTLDESGIPPEKEREAARLTSRILAPHLRDRNGLQFQIKDARGQSQLATLPPMAVRLLVDLLSEMAKGNAVTLIPIHAELTTQQAAEVLNVSRPFVVRLIKEKKLPAHRVGTHRRVRFADLMAFKSKIDAERGQALDALAEQAQELQMGY